MSLSLSFGAVLFDCFEDRRHIGGAPLNFAWNLRQFGFPVAMVSAIGRDELGREIRDFMVQADIDTSWLGERDEPTGTVDITLTNGEPDFIINEGVAWDYIDLLKTPETTPDLIYYGTVDQRTGQNRQALQQLLQSNPTQAFFDINLRQHYFTDEIIIEGLQHATIVKFNEVEWQVLRSITKLETLKELSEKYAIDVVALTRGAERVDFYTQGCTYTAQPPVVSVTDTVGSGDAFSGALAAGVMQGIDPAVILETACAAGAEVAGQAGAHVTLSDRVLSPFKKI